MKSFQLMSFARPLFAGLLLSLSSVADAQFLAPDARFSRDSSMAFARGGPVETGSVDGVSFEIYRDGSGTTSGWDRHCAVDPMTDERLCLVTQGDISIIVNRNGVSIISIGSEHFPGSQVFLRIDEAVAQVTAPPGWGGAAAVKLISKMASGKKLVTRYTKWPDRAATDGVTQSEGLKQSIGIATWAARQK